MAARSPGSGRPRSVPCLTAFEAVVTGGPGVTDEHGVGRSWSTSVHCGGQRQSPHLPDGGWRKSASSGCFGSWFGEGEALVAEVGDDLEPAAECFDVGGDGAQFGGAWLGVLDGRYPALGDSHAVGYLGLAEPEAAAHLGEPVGALLGPQPLHPGGDGGPVLGVGEELVQELVAGVAAEFLAAHRCPSCFRYSSYRSSASGMALRYHDSHCPAWSPATSRTALRFGSNTYKILISLRPAEPGRSSFRLASRE